ncbi:MAG: hypothetical protein ACI9MR_000346 [Myxococcota bacterium]|jgi:hypothetical protein
MWDAQEGNDQELGDLETVAKTVAYVIANPVASDQSPTANRPRESFRAGGPVGEVAHQCPPGIAPDGFRVMVKLPSTRYWRRPVEPFP